MHRGKVDPGVSELPRGNELSRDHVNRPLVTFQSYSDSRPWLWTSDFDCYELNGGCQLSLIDYY